MNAVYLIGILANMNTVQYNERCSVMAISAPRAQHRKAVRGTILEAARKTLIDKGPGSFSMRGLAAEIGCSPGTIYLYFKDREHLLSSVVDEGFDKLLEILVELHDSQDPLQSLRNKLRAYIDFGLRFPNHYRVAFIQRRSGRAVTSDDPPHASFDVLRDSVRACMDQDLIVSSDVEKVSQILWTAIHGVTSLLIVFPKFPWTERAELIDSTIEMALDGLASPASSRRRKRGIHGRD